MVSKRSVGAVVRKLFRGRCCAAGWIVLALVGTAQAADHLRVKTDEGKVEGKLSADGQVRDFLGIPYAAPPVGPLRWKAPAPARKWKGVRQTVSFGFRCMQPALNPDMYFRDPGQSEDCLTLNVWTPATAAKRAKLPVMVWIFGGGFVTGGTSEARQDGEHLAHHGVVVVSMNYRLGVFGFFAHRELAAESPEHAAGNYGLLDQTAALRWVQRNIQNFGGDPENVTIFGESAGSISVSAQMASPLARGLFAHAIGESGGALGNIGNSFRSLAASEEAGEAFASSDLGKSSLAELRAIPADDLLKAAAGKGMGPGRPFWPNIDGYFFPQNPVAIYAAGQQAHVPLLGGWNKDEMTLAVVRAPEPPTEATMRALASKEYPGHEDAFLKAYAVSPDEDAVRVAEDLAGDRFIAFSTWAWLEAQVNTGEKPVYRYRFDQPSPGDPNHPAAAGAFHSDEIEYVFGNLDTRRGAAWRPEDYKLSELMQTYWTNFAKTGDPNGPGAPQWPTYNAADGWQVMHLDPNPQPQPDKHRDRYLFLEEALKK